MSAVFLVEDTHLKGKNVALKIALDPEREEVLNREFDTLRNLRHPNLVEVFDYGFDSESNRHFFTSEYLDGKTLIEAAGSLPVEDFLRLVVQCLQTLAFIHSKGYLHYDIKPENLLVIPGKGGGYNLKLIDFGLVGAMTKTTASIRGSLDFVAPEVLRGRQSDARSDLYSFGNTLRAVFNSFPETRVRSDDLKQIAEITEKLSADDPDARYDSAEDALSALGVVVGRTLTAMPAHSAVSSLFSNKLIGRERELRELTSRFDGIFLKDISEIAPHGKSKIVLKKSGPGIRTHETNPLVLVAGEFGIGKTRLMDELRHRAQANDVRFVPCRFLEHSPGLPFVFDFLERATKLLPDEHPVRDELERELAAVREPYDMAKAIRGELAIPQRIRLRFLMRSVEFLIQLAEEIPFVTAFWDMQWADAFTLEFVNYLIRAVTDALQDGRHAPIMVLGTCRIEEISRSPFQNLMNELREEDLLIEIKLEPLEKKDIFTFLHSMLRTTEVPQELMNRIHADSRGNPFFIIEILKTMRQEKILIFENGEWAVSQETLTPETFEKTTLPRSIEFVLKRQLKQLSREAGLVLRTLAVLRRPVEPDFLSALPELASMDIKFICTDLCERHVLVHDDSRYYFTQAGMAKIISSAMPEDERIRLHTIAIEMLENVAEKDLDVYSDLAYHSYSAGDSELTLKYVLLAGKLFAEAYENEKALGFYNRALETAGTERRRLDIWVFIQEKRADLFRVLGRFEKALSTLGEILQRFHELKITEERTARLLRSRGSILERLGRYTDGRQDYEKGLETLGPYTKSAEKVRTLAALGRISMYQGDYNDSMSHSLEALKVLGESEEGLDHARVYTIVANTHFFLGNFTQALEFHERALEIRQKGGTLYEQAESLNAIGLVGYSEALYGEAIKSFRKVHEITEKSGDIFGHAYALVNLAETFFTIGMYSESSTHLEAATEASEDNDMKYVRSLCYVLAGRNASRLERFAEAREYYRMALALYTPMGNRDGMCRTTLALAELEIKEGNFEAADKQLSSAEKLAMHLESKELLAQYHLLGGELLLKNKGDFQRIASVWTEGLALLQDGLSPETAIKLNRKLGDINVSLRDIESAEHCHASAGRIIQDVASRLEPELANVFLKEHAARESGIRYSEKAKTEPPTPAEEVTKENQEIVSLLTDENRRLREVLKLGNQLSPNIGWMEFLKQACESLISVTGALRAFHLKMSGRHADVQFGLSYTGDEIKPEDAGISLTLAERAMKTERPILSKDAAQDSRFAKYGSVAGYHVQSVLIMPFILPGEEPEAIYLDHPYQQNAFREEHMQAVQAVMGFLRIAADYKRWRDTKSDDETRRFQQEFGGLDLEF
jgi:serine/threonine protein kinase/tetratricopeptide (TPR) repeat protein